MKGQMTIPNILMTIATLAFFAVSMNFIYISIVNGLSGVPSTNPESFIANLIPGSLTLTLFVSIIIYGIIKYV